MKKIILIFCLLFIFNSCQTVSNKIDEKMEVEEKELTKWINKSETQLKINFGSPDKIEFKENSRNRYYVYLKEKLKIKLIRKDVGDINVITEMKKNNYNLGGEQSGHIILGQYVNTGDGILVALKITESLTKHNIKASKMFNLYEPYPQIKTNLHIVKKITKNVDDQIKTLYLNYKNQYKDLRFLIRKSGTEPLLRILVEGKNIVMVKKISSLLIKELEKNLNVK